MSKPFIQEMIEHLLLQQAEERSKMRHYWCGFFVGVTWTIIIIVLAKCFT